MNLQEELEKAYKAGWDGAYDFCTNVWRDEEEDNWGLKRYEEIREDNLNHYINGNTEPIEGNVVLGEGLSRPD